MCSGRQYLVCFEGPNYTRFLVLNVKGLSSPKAILSVPMLTKYNFLIVFLRLELIATRVKLITTWAWLLKAPISANTGLRLPYSLK